MNWLKSKIETPKEMLAVLIKNKAYCSVLVDPTVMGLDIPCEYRSESTRLQLNSTRLQLNSTVTLTDGGIVDILYFPIGNGGAMERYIIAIPWSAVLEINAYKFDLQTRAHWEPPTIEELSQLRKQQAFLAGDVKTLNLKQLTIISGEKPDLD